MGLMPAEPSLAIIIIQNPGRVPSLPRWVSCRRSRPSPTRSHHLLRQEDRDALVIDRAAPGPPLVAAVAEAAVRAGGGARIVALADDGHRAIVERIATHALV